MEVYTVSTMYKPTVSVLSKSTVNAIGKPAQTTFGTLKIKGLLMILVAKQPL